MPCQKQIAKCKMRDLQLQIRIHSEIANLKSEPTILGSETGEEKRIMRNCKLEIHNRKPKIDRNLENQKRKNRKSDMQKTNREMQNVQSAIANKNTLRNRKLEI
jgi:hypothetical protein